MRKLLALAIIGWTLFVLACSYADSHCEGEHARECAVEYGLFQPCSLGLDDR